MRWEYSEKVFNREKKILGLIKKRQDLRFKKEAEIEAWEKDVFVQLKAVVELQQVPSTDPVASNVDGMSSQINTEKRGRPKKRLSDDPGDKTSHKIMDNMLNNLACFADEENVTTAPYVCVTILILFSFYIYRYVWVLINTFMLHRTPEFYLFYILAQE